ETATCDKQCRAIVCGDGKIQGKEQCDDGNTVAGDGCSPDCKPEPVTCTGTIDLTVNFVSGPGTDHAKNVYGIDVSVGYPPATSFPGDGMLPVGDPSDPSTRLILLGGGVNLYAALASFLDGQAPFCPCNESSTPSCDPTAVPRQLGCPATGIRTALNFA